jgi:hypothetical protein
MSKKQILDPLSCLCKIAILTFYDKGTKISIKDNIILISQPNNMQWIKRTYYGDGKNDISTLYNPILKAIDWYVLNKDDDINIEPIRNIIKYAIIGLDKLQTTYENGNVILAIKFLKNNLNMCLNDNFTINDFVSINEIKDTENVINYDKIKKIWTNEKINIISNQLDIINKNINVPNSLEHLLKSIKAQLMDIDSRFQNLVENMNTNL